MLYVRGIEGGTYNIIIQNFVITDDLSTSSTPSEVSYAVRSALESVNRNYLECFYLEVQSMWSPSKKVLKIKVTFNIDNTKAMTLLDVYTGNLLGKQLL